MTVISITRRRWIANYHSLAEYKEKFGNCNVPFNYKDNPELGRWVKRQRFQYRLLQSGKNNSSHITEERIRLLEDIGFVWDLHEVQWQKMYKELQKFHAEEGHSDVPIKFPALGMWVSNQRSQIKLYKLGKSSSITPTRLAALSKLNFRWEVKSSHSKHNNHVSRKPRIYKQTNKSTPARPVEEIPTTTPAHVSVQYPETKPSLAVKTEMGDKNRIGLKEPLPASVTIEEAKSSVVSISSEDQQETSSFVQDMSSKESSPFSSRSCSPTISSSSSRVPSPTSSDTESNNGGGGGFDKLLMLSVLSGEENNIWSQHVQQLVKFQKEHGHTTVPLKHPNGLGRWVKRQRYQYKLYQQGKAANITEDRIRVLDGIGFVWDLHEVQWLKMYDELMEFKRKNGHCDVPISVTTLGTWVTYQRYLFRLEQEGKPSSLTEKRKIKLEEAGFRWEIRGFQQKTVERHEAMRKKREKKRDQDNNLKMMMECRRKEKEEEHGPIPESIGVVEQERKRAILELREQNQMQQPVAAQSSKQQPLVVEQQKQKTTKTASKRGRPTKQKDTVSTSKRQRLVEQKPQTQQVQNTQGQQMQYHLVHPSSQSPVTNTNLEEHLLLQKQNNHLFQLSKSPIKHNLLMSPNNVALLTQQHNIQQLQQESSLQNLNMVHSLNPATLNLLATLNQTTVNPFLAQQKW